jgi:hypothetical protein
MKPNEISRQLPLLLVACCGVAFFATNANAQSDDATRWSISPYIWGSNTTVDLTFRDTNIGAGDVSFGDLLDILDAAFMVHVEGGKGNWSAFGDFTFLKTSDTTARPLITIDADNEQVFLDTAVAYWPAGFGSQLSLFGGLRYSGFDDRYRFSVGGTQIGEQLSTKDYYDVLLGLRYRFELAERWELLTHGDFSFGDSEGTLLLRANVAYVVGKHRQNRILIGYQYKEAKFRDGDLTTDFSYAGPMAGFNFRF